MCSCYGSTEFLRNQLGQLCSRLTVHKVSLRCIPSAHWGILFVVLHVLVILTGVRLFPTLWVAMYNH